MSVRAGLAPVGCSDVVIEGEQVRALREPSLAAGTIGPVTRIGLQCFGQECDTA